MPSKSLAQERFFQAAAHSPEFAKKGGISQSVAKEWAAEDSARDADLPERAGARKIAKALRE